MATNRKVEKWAEITVNLGDMQFIKLHSMAGEEFEYSSEDDRIAKETEVWHSIASDLRVALVDTLKILGKKTAAPEKFAEKCDKKINPKGQTE